MLVDDDASSEMHEVMTEEMAIKIRKKRRTEWQP